MSKSICTFNPNFLESAVSVAFLTNDSLRATFVMKDTKVFRQADGRSCLPFMPLGRGEGGRDGDRARIALDCAPRGVSDAIRRFFLFPLHQVIFLQLQVEVLAPLSPQKLDPQKRT